MQSLKFFYTVLWQIFSSFTNVKDIDMFLLVRGNRWKWRQSHVGMHGVGTYSR